MSGFAKVTLIGNLGADPDVRFTASGTAVCNLRVACTDRAKGKDGEWADRTEWVSLVVFGKTAENAGQYLAKGRQIYADGRLQTREWNDKDGNKRYSTEVVADQVLFLGGGGERGAPSTSSRSGGDAAGGASAPQENIPNDDDIPF